MPTTTLTTQFKLDCLKAGHSFKASGGATYKCLLIKAGASGTYDKTLTNVGTPGTGTPSTSNVGTDEVTSTNYTSGGFALTNVDPTISGSTAIADFSTNPNWTNVSFSAIAAVIYASDSSFGSAGRTVAVYDLGGTQTVSGANFTLDQPAFAAATALIAFGPGT